MASAILGLGLVLVLGALGALQEHASRAAARHRTVEGSRRLAELISREVRDLNLASGDLPPSFLIDDTRLEYRRVVGYDPVTGPLLDPARTTGEFRAIALDGARVVQRTPAGEFTLADGVADLRFTLTPPNLLTIRVAMAVEHPPGETVSDAVEVTVVLQNRLP